MGATKEAQTDFRKTLASPQAHGAQVGCEVKIACKPLALAGGAQIEDEMCNTTLCAQGVDLLAGAGDHACFCEGIAGNPDTNRLQIVVRRLRRPHQHAIKSQVVVCQYPEALFDVIWRHGQFSGVGSGST